jgi:aspartyl-tRNA(Asn)/glutamyl-tRNA(Gln) amidotransferase subunit A
VQAHRLRRELTHAVTSMLQRYDALLTACTIAPAPLIKASRDRVSDSPTQSMPFNVTGHPALSIPAGFSSDGLPLSMQLAGRHFDEATILRIAAAFEAHSGLNKKRPALAT